MAMMTTPTSSGSLCSRGALGAMKGLMSLEESGAVALRGALRSLATTRPHARERLRSKQGAT